MKSESTDSSIIFTAFFVLCAVVCPPSILMVFVFFLSGASLANGQQTCNRPKEKFYLIIPSHLVFTLFGTCEAGLLLVVLLMCVWNICFLVLCQLNWNY